MMVLFAVRFMRRKISRFPRQVGNLSGESAVNHRQAHAALLALANPNKAELLAGFFKTGKGQYAEGDHFPAMTSRLASINAACRYASAAHAHEPRSPY
jgi:hypothetical protein